MTMILSVVAVAALGLALGWLLGLASQWLGATTDPVVERIAEALLWGGARFDMRAQRGGRGWMPHGVRV